MATATFSRFLSLANQHRKLIVDLCIEQDPISRAQLLNYLERHAIPVGEKNKLIEKLCDSDILFEEMEQYYTVNPNVMSLVNYYERRGRLTSSKFLLSTIAEINKLTNDLQRQLFAEEKSKETILDLLDQLYHLVRNVRDVGYNHYLACMHLFGEMKRTSESKSIAQRLAEVEILQRQHINHLRELIDPSADYTRQIELLRRRMSDLRAQNQLLTESQELDSRRRRLEIDLEYIDHILLGHFKKISDTARSTLNSLLEQKSIKDAVARCLAELSTTWDYLEGQTIVAPALTFKQSPSLDKLAEFWADVIHLRLIPHPTPLSVPQYQKMSAEEHLISERRIWHSIESARSIASWPNFVLDSYAHYPSTEQLKAITTPLIVPHPNIELIPSESPFICSFEEFQIEMKDFGVTWKATNVKKTSTKKRRNLSKAIPRLPI